MRPKLTPEEARVAALKELGLTGKVIAERMDCSISHVTKIWKSVREKVGASKRGLGRPTSNGKTHKPKGNS